MRRRWKVGEGDERELVDERLRMQMQTMWMGAVRLNDELCDLKYS